MSLSKTGEVNPLTVFGLREVNQCPPHFHKVVFDLSTSQKKISDWVWENLTGRFYVGPMYVTDASGKNELSFVAAFEDHSEASFFSIYLPSINVSDFF